MTFQKILSLDADQVLDLAKTNPKELRAITSRLGSAANKRTKRLTERLKPDELPYVVEKFVDDGKYEGLRGKDTPQVVEEYQRLRAFLRNKGTTFAGQQEYAAEFGRRVGLPSDMNYKELNKIQRALDRIQEANPDLFRYLVSSSQMVDNLREEVEASKNKSVNQLVRDMQKKIDELYKSEQKRGSDVSGFFDGGGDKFAL